MKYIDKPQSTHVFEGFPSETSYSFLLGSPWWYATVSDTSTSLPPSTTAFIQLKQKVESLQQKQQSIQKEETHQTQICHNNNDDHQQNLTASPAGNGGMMFINSYSWSSQQPPVTTFSTSCCPRSWSTCSSLESPAFETWGKLGLHLFFLVWNVENDMKTMSILKISELFNRNMQFEKLTYSVYFLEL